MTNLIIVGLGNPGKNYNHTRHNIGATWVKKLCAKHNTKLKSTPKLAADLAELNNTSVICAIPQDYMNHSGMVVKKIIRHYYRYYNQQQNNLLVIHDDLALPPGEARIKLSGGHGGHNGIRNIIEQLQTDNFTRLRIGIGHPQIREQVSDYVLSPASYEEQIAINTAIERSLGIDNLLLNSNWQQAISYLHQNKLTGETNGV